MKQEVNACAIALSIVDRERVHLGRIVHKEVLLTCGDSESRGGGLELLKQKKICMQNSCFLVTETFDAAAYDNVLLPKINLYTLCELYNSVDFRLHPYMRATFPPFELLFEHA